MQDHHDFDFQRNQNLDWMKPHAGGDVDIEVGMMHPVQPPQHRNLVEDDVLEIDDEIERQEPDQRRDREPQVQIIDQPPAVARREQGRADRRRRNQRAHGQDVDNQDAEIVGPPPAAADREPAPRRENLPQRKGCEEQAECAQANDGFDDGAVHGLNIAGSAAQTAVCFLPADRREVRDGGAVSFVQAIVGFGCAPARSAASRTSDGAMPYCRRKRRTK